MKGSSSVDGTVTNYYKKISGLLIVFDFYRVIFVCKNIKSAQPFFCKTDYLDKLTNEFIYHNTRKINCNNNYFTILKPIYLIIYLAVHLFLHKNRGYNRYCLLDNVIRLENKNIDWDSIINVSKKYSLEEIIFPIFLLLNQHYQIKIPKLSFREIIRSVNNYPKLDEVL
jgi:hypothetical protein